MTVQERKAQLNARSKKFYEAHPERQKAKSSVQAAFKRFEKVIQDPTSSKHLRGRIIIKPIFCPLCGSHVCSQSLHGHHYRGYDHPYDVFYVCVKCHGEITARERAATLLGLPTIAGLASVIGEKREVAKKQP